MDKAARTQQSTENNWYHYSTKLELNIKELRDQIVKMEDKFSELQDQLAKEQG